VSLRHEKLDTTALHDALPIYRRVEVSDRERIVGVAALDVYPHAFIARLPGRVGFDGGCVGGRGRGAARVISAEQHDGDHRGGDRSEEHKSELQSSFDIV